MPRKIFSRLALYTIALFLFTQKNLLAQKNFENVDPTVSQFEIIRGSGDPDYTGALNFKIPLMKVPGRGGLDYALELSYCAWQRRSSRRIRLVGRAGLEFEFIPG